ncbi:hypothetical protein [Actinoallomurus iriomotensis]|uniref:hypothetical protein n=1 Tax=Actinoallomurus iriomotensis TaxID=478107 RepID=UPI002552F914|nr:hypothetical protein [Actinoallomurus iriomotensis]
MTVTLASLVEQTGLSVLDHLERSMAIPAPGTCRWTGMVTDTNGLTLGAFEATAPVYLLHAEHGATGCAPGKYAVRRQREFEGRRARLVAD